MDRVSTHIWRTELFICYIDCVWPCVYALPLSTEKKEKSSPSIFISYHIHIMHCKENYINSRMYNDKVWNSSMFFVHFLIICFPLFGWFIFRGSKKWRKQFWWSKIDNRWLCCVNIVASIFITAHKHHCHQRSEARPWNKDKVNEWCCIVYSAPSVAQSVFTITEKAPTRAFSWLKAPTSTFTFKTLC